MATDFWASSHYKRWIVDRNSLKRARAEDLLYVDNPEDLDFFPIYFANLIARLGRKLQLRQRVIATATVFFHRFYLKNAYCETEPFIVVAACCYVAAKAEESPVHIKNVVTEARLLFGAEEYGNKSFPSDNTKLAEMEFYLVDDLECDLVVFHPYRTLMTLCVKEGDSSIGDIDEFKSDRPRYWGTGEGRLELKDSTLQLAWFIINDTYRTSLCLLYPPHLIAIAALSLTLVLDPNSRASLHLTPLSDESSCNNQSSSQSSSTSTAPTRRSSRSTASSPKRQKTPDIVEFMAGLNVNMSLVATIVQEMISLYTLWERYKDDGSDPTSAPFGGTNHFSSLPGHRRGATARSGSVMSGGTLSTAGTPNTSEDMHHHTMHQTHGHIVNPGYLSRLLLKMREAKMVDIGHGPGSGNPRLTAHNKRLDRAQTAG